MKNFTFLLLTFALPLLAVEAPVSITETVGLPKVLTAALPKVNALLQAWSINDNSNHLTSALNFRLRRAELKLSGSAAEGTRYFFMVDAAKSITPTGDSRMIQDLGVAYSITKEIEVIAGQFKTQTTAESFVSSAELPLPERSMEARKYGDRREPGLMVAFKNHLGKVGVMISNGQGPNNDAKDTKDLSLRVDSALIKNVDLGAFVLLGDFKFDTKNRWGFNTTVKLGNGILKSEYAMGRDGNVNSHGFNVDLAYAISESLESVGRFELMKTNTELSPLSQAETLGVNYLISKHTAKIQATASFLHNVTGKNGSYEALSAENGTLFTLAFQMAI